MEEEVLGDLVTCNGGRQTHRGSVRQRISKPSCLAVLPPHGYSWLGNQFIVCIMHLKATLNIWCGWGSIAKQHCFSCNRAAHLSPTHTRKKSHCVPHEWYVMAGHYVMLRETDSNWTDWWTRSPPREETSKDYNRYALWVQDQECQLYLIVPLHAVLRVLLKLGLPHSNSLTTLHYI